MESLLLQEWLTLRGASSIATLTQPEPDWLDVGAYQDLVIWTEVKEFTPPSGLSIPAILYQTSPSKDDALFFNMRAQAQVQLGVTTTVLLKASGAGFPPCARWLRWQIVMSGGLAWDLTFRIWVAANRVGNRVPIAEPRCLGEGELHSSVVDSALQTRQPLGHYELAANPLLAVRQQLQIKPGR